MSLGRSELRVCVGGKRIECRMGVQGAVGHATPPTIHLLLGHVGYGETSDYTAVYHDVVNFQ
jgi:hypothetical protein